MKKLLLTLACAWMLCTASMKAQITLDFENDTIAFDRVSFIVLIFMRMSPNMFI